MDRYTEAHLFVAAIRLLAHRLQRDPSLEEVSELLSISVELGHTTGRKLAKQGIITIREDPFTVTVSIADHLKIEDLPRQAAPEDSLARELEAFRQKQKSSEKKIQSIQAELQKKKKQKFSEIEARLKKELEKKQ